MLSYSMCLCPLILSGHFSKINYSLASKNYQAAGISLGDFTLFGYFALKIRFECCYLLCILEHRKHCTTIVCWSGMAGDILGKERERRLMVHLGNKEVVFYWLFNASANSSGYMANKRLINQSTSSSCLLPYIENLAISMTDMLNSVLAGQAAIMKRLGELQTEIRAVKAGSGPAALPIDPAEEFFPILCEEQLRDMEEMLKRPEFRAAVVS